MKRTFDVLLAFFGLIVIAPLLLVIGILIKLTSKGPVFYRQVRVGKNNKDFKIFKFRTMRVDADKLGLLTIGGNDPRVTKIGYYLRKYKLDELSQLINVLIGDMSFVGPRPEVRKYVDLYNKEQLKVLVVKPGITDLASIEFRNENEILSSQENPNSYYINVIMPKKLQINLDYLKQRTLMKDIGVIFKTFLVIIN
ncbi:Sugar transferase involved in LPS biosynthesis (colanic, teichoic acid) [Lutibacter agarilyticus]|uniref:Sugar transferase involved in LPS biosynthesis (Colanic, teichoic acid) n=1 Tax=Lutibacter agarilyticus TaxID=1109740 RepID=A0A238YUY5_9FLAO|nr:sugar transferase [Lutibacter agarilyticus]SNR74531.1 Sugar transferase involved in LPS biosynthesis (colanic, teichoic acid) [Lutibacter agarilyticus]